MSQEFRLRYDQMRENAPQSQSADPSPSALADHYAEPGYARSLCFGWPDGRRLFLSYSYLIAGEYVPEQNTVALQFTTHHIALTGTRLEALYTLIMYQMAKLILVSDPRYELLEEGIKSVVHSIVVTAKD